MTPDEVRSALDGVDLKEVAKEVRVDYTTLWRFKTGKTQSPSWELVEKLAAYLRRQQ